MAEKDVILLVDDEEDLLESCARILEEEDCACITTTDSMKVRDLVFAHRPKVIVLDFMMPGKNGQEILREMMVDFPGFPIIMISAYATVDRVVEAVKLGAFDYLTKPFSSDQLVIAVRRALEQVRLQEENRRLETRLKDDFFNHYLVGKHPKFLATIELVRKVAATASNALICGEAGVGKEVAARAVHLLSDRADAPFAVADGAVVAAEVFDLKAADGKEGLFEKARGGVLYIENVDALDMAGQVALARSLQELKEAPRAQEGNPDVRVIASTTADLYSLVAQRKFRESLYYALNVVTIRIPPLRERKEDIGILCDHFFRAAAKGSASPLPALHPDTLAKLMEYDWPGNVSQLRYVLERSAGLAENGAVMAEHLPDEVRFSLDPKRLLFKEARKEWLDKFERRYLENLLFTNKGNISRASEMAGIARMSLYRMLKRTGLQNLVVSERAGEKETGASGDAKGKPVE